MAKSTGNRKATKINLPATQKSQSVATLPIGEVGIAKIRFSFELFDRKHEDFNLGGRADDGTVGGKWFLQLLDCLKDVSGKPISEMTKKPYELHRVDWKKANVACPAYYPQVDWYQFRINKSRGRVIGMLVDKIFYVFWLDPYHNLTYSEGYGGVRIFRKPEL